MEKVTSLWLGTAGAGFKNQHLTVTGFFSSCKYMEVRGVVGKDGVLPSCKCGS